MTPPQNHLELTFLFLFSLLTLASSHPTSPGNHLLLPSSRKLGRDESLFCESWRFTVEANDAGVWSTIPSRCCDFVKDYMTGDRFLSDSTSVAANSLEFAKSVNVSGDGKDAWVFDVDETLLFNLPYYDDHGFGSEVFNEEVFDEWVLLAVAPALPASLSLYKELQQLGFTIFVLTGRSEPYRNATVANLRNAGYSNWQELILRGPSDQGKKAVVYKSERRKKLEDEGYRIRGNSGDQWSDLWGGSELLDAPRCFNCGAYSHSLKECPKPRDNAAVNNSRKQLKVKRNQTAGLRNPTRHYQDSPGGKYEGLRPGVLDTETRRLLGLGEFDPPPWLNRMREIGYPPGYLVWQV